MTYAKISRGKGRQLADEIEQAITNQPATVPELVKLLSASRAVIADRLKDMQAEGAAYFVQVRTKGGLGLAHLWHAGSDPAAEKLPVSQRVVYEYPQNPFRDPLVAALFGPANQSQGA